MAAVGLLVYLFLFLLLVAVITIAIVAVIYFRKKSLPADRQEERIRELEEENRKLRERLRS